MSNMVKNSRGFTIIELMISVSALSALLLLCTIGIIQISQSYFKGIIQASTQQTVRAIVDTFSQTVQYGGASSIATATETTTVAAVSYTVRTICVGTQRFSYALNYQQIGGSPQIANRELKHGLWQDLIGDQARCSGVRLDADNPSTSPIDGVNVGSEGRELLGDRMRLMGLTIEKCSGAAVGRCSPNSSENLFRVRLAIMYGGSDLVDTASYNETDPTTWASLQCRSKQAIIGTAFCAKSDLTTIVGKRLR